MIEYKGEVVPIKAWVEGIEVESAAIEQLKNLAKMPFIFKHIAVMPDVHLGMGATIGSVIPTKGAVIPAAVGVDIGCGMLAMPTSLTIDDVQEDRRARLRAEIERLVPTGRTNRGGKGDKGAWADPPKRVVNMWRTHLEAELAELVKKHRGIRGHHGLNDLIHLGTLGGGNHFIEICLDLNDRVWVMLHSGSRGVGNRIGQYFIKQAKEVCHKGSGKERDKLDRELKAYLRSNEFLSMSKRDRKRNAEDLKKEYADRKRSLGINLPHQDLAFFEEGTELFDDYVKGVQWAQRFAQLNRDLMLEGVMEALRNVCGKFIAEEPVNCHHNYVQYEEHFGEKVLVTRKGAINASLGEMGIIPGSMGAKSYIVKGKGNPESFNSASHGAGRRMSRSQAKRTFTIEDHRAATEGIECPKGEAVLDETPLAYKDIDMVMKAEEDLVEPVHQLRQIICIKGTE